MRVLHLSDRLSVRGGAHWHLRGVLEAQVARGDAVHLACGVVEPGADPPCPLSVVAALAERGPVEAGAALDALAGSVPHDVLHVHTVMNPAVLSWAAARGAVATVQDHRVFCPGRGKLTAGGEVCREPMARATCAPCFADEAYFAEVLHLTEARRAALGGMRAVVVLSRSMQAEMVAAGVARDRVAVVPPFAHGLDPAAASDGPPCVLFAGRLVDAKGVFDAVAAWRRSGVGLPLVMAGTGPRRTDLESAGAEVLGWVPHERLSAVYRRARALLMPSRWQEPFGIVGLEALTLGVPVVAWESGGIADWHPGPLGPWGDVAALADRLRGSLGARVEPPRGFERDALMARLDGVYGRVSSA